MYSTYNEGKSVVVDRFVRTLKNKIYKNMTAISKNVYIDVLTHILDEYNNTYHRTIKMKSIDVKSDSFAEYNEESNEKDPKFKIGIMLEFQNTKKCLQKIMNQTGVKKSFQLKELKILYVGHM